MSLSKYTSTQLLNELLIRHKPEPASSAMNASMSLLEATIPINEDCDAWIALFRSSAEAVRSECAAVERDGDE